MKLGNWPALAGELDSLKVGAAPAAAKGASRAAPGLFLASTRRYVLSIGGAPGGGSCEDAPNTGTYAVNGGRVSMRTLSGETVEGRLAAGELAIENTKFKKAALK